MTEATTEDTPICGYEDTQSGDPCTQPAHYDDGRCGFHTDSDKSPQDRPDHVSFRLQKGTHERVTAHQRDSETLGATIDRALDALEREAEYPEAVRQAVKDGE